MFISLKKYLLGKNKNCNADIDSNINADTELSMSRYPNDCLSSNILTLLCMKYVCNVNA